MSEWEEVTLGEVITFKRGHDLSKKNMRNGTVPVAGSSGIVGFHDASTTEKPAVIIGRSGSIGQVYWYDDFVWAHNTALNVEDFQGNDQRFIFYWLHQFDFTRFNTGSAVPSLNRNHLHQIQCTVPPLKSQEAIAEVLSSLDDKIDLLKRQNKTLEGMAEALFRQWFIEEAQDDWELCTFGDFFPVKTGKKDANYSTEDGPYPFFTCSQEVSKSPDFSFNGKAILLAGNGNFNVKRYNGKFEAYQRTYVLIPEDPSLHAWLFFHLRFALQKIVMGSRGSVISFLTKGLIQDHEFTKPSELEKHKLDELDKLLEATDANEAQIKNLTLQRDTLLPKLMSGEVRVQMD